SYWASSPELPVTSSLVLDQLVVYSDFELPVGHRLLRDLDTMRDDLSDQLAVEASDEQVHVYLFKTPRRYKQFLKQYYPEFPDRRAFFVKTDVRLSVYTFWGDRIAEDLRHEVAHGYLHASIPVLPLWLDEGLAEYFEVDAGEQGFNRSHAELLDEQSGGAWQPDLRQLEEVTNFKELKQIQYAEAWLWVHFMLRTTPDRKKVLQDHLAGFQKRSTKPFSEVLFQAEPNAEQHLLEHLNSVRKLLSQDGTTAKLLESN
ncbi:MAG: DUF1570 domain-containing protein, partial [Planctomycetales bacterium]